MYVIAYVERLIRQYASLKKRHAKETVIISVLQSEYLNRIYTIREKNIQVIDVAYMKHFVISSFNISSLDISWL